MELELGDDVTKRNVQRICTSPAGAGTYHTCDFVLPVWKHWKMYMDTHTHTPLSRVTKHTKGTKLTMAVTPCGSAKVSYRSRLLIFQPHDSRNTQRDYFSSATWEEIIFITVCCMFFVDSITHKLRELRERYMICVQILWHTVPMYDVITQILFLCYILVSCSFYLSVT